MIQQLRNLNAAHSSKSKPRSLMLTRAAKDEILCFSVIGGLEKGSGIFITKVEKGSKAYIAGLKRGDQVSLVGSVFLLIIYIVGNVGK